MKIANILLAIGMIGVVSAGPCFAQEAAKKDAPTATNEAIKADRDAAIKLTKDYVKFERMTVVANNLELAPAEREAFWQEYGKFQDQVDLLRDRAAKLIVDYSEKFDTLTDADAKAMLNEMLSIQEDEAKVRRECLPKFEAILPAKKVARFYQLENKMNAEIRYAMSLEIPLVETEELAVEK
jgi:hypothetical protein